MTATITDLEHSLIPVNGAYISKAKFPEGYFVAKYDAEGFTSAPRWFPTIEKAKAYAEGLVS